MAAGLVFLKPKTEDRTDGGRLAGAFSVFKIGRSTMAEERDPFANGPEQGEEVEGHKFSPDDDEFEELDSSEGAEDDEVEAHKF
jgi:hypothetical protein